MEDISQGKKRVRSWPTKRGKPKTQAQADRQDKFAQAQWAARYISPQQMCDIINARKGTPLLPRDLVTSMLYNRLAAFIFPDGKVWYPMAARQDVSDCLDSITQSLGFILVRREEGWVGEPKPGGGGGAAGLLFSSYANSGTAANNSEQVLASFELPANTLANDGDALRYEVSNQLANTSRQRDSRIRLNGVVIDSIGTNVSGERGAWFTATLIRTSNTTARIRQERRWLNSSDRTAFDLYNVADLSGFDFLAAQTVEITGQVGGSAVANDIINRQAIFTYNA